MQTTTDLVRAAAGGDETAWNTLTEHFTGLLWAIARAHRLSASDAGDVVQTTWLRLVENLGRLREPERVGAWLATTARHESLRVVRRAARQVPTGDDLDVTIDVSVGAGPAWVTADPTPEQAVVATERDRILHAAIDQLPDRCRVLIRMLMTDPPPSYDVVSATLDMPIGSIGPTRARCLQRLRHHLAAAGMRDQEMA